MLLRDNLQMAVNAVETLCFETADGYASAAARTERPEVARLFADLAAQRNQLAAELAAHIRALDDLPQQPDPDREAMVQMLSGIKALLSGDANAALIDERTQAEDKLAAAAHDALLLELPSETRSMLERLLAHVASSKQELAAVRH